MLQVGLDTAPSDPSYLHPCMHAQLCTSTLDHALRRTRSTSQHSLTFSTATHFRPTRSMHSYDRWTDDHLP